MLPLVVTIAALGLVCVLYGIFIERFRYRVIRHRLDILPAAAERPLLLLHLSDLHFVRHDPRKARFLAELPTPDVTVVTGDFLAEPEGIRSAVDGVRPVRGRLASWFVLGSNDYFVPKPLNYLAYFRKSRKRRTARRGRGPELVRALAADGWVDITNVRHQVSLEGLDVELLGLDDAHIRRHDLRTAPRSAEDRFGFAVMHSPDSAPEAAALGYRLIVAGHTHGGQVRLPFLGALVTNSSMPRRLVSGLIRMGTAVLHTSPGLGTSKYAPFRFWCRPEATYLELRPRAGSSGHALD
ncbi:MAG TPA: metallophosphoesterase [Actinomycetota bacterium]|nr:metallophosphoesterase [Actinomycetota bacterium]